MFPQVVQNYKLGETRNSTIVECRNVSGFQETVCQKLLKSDNYWPSDSEMLESGFYFDSQCRTDTM